VQLAGYEEPEDIVLFSMCWQVQRLKVDGKTIEKNQSTTMDAAPMDRSYFCCL
jgi:hypothetical protein